MYFVVLTFTKLEMTKILFAFIRLGLQTGWPWFYFLQQQGLFSLLPCPNRLCGQSSYLFKGTLSPEVEQLQHEADHSPPSGDEFKNAWSTTPLLHMSTWYSAEVRNNYHFFWHTEPYWRSETLTPEQTKNLLYTKLEY